MLPRQLHLTTSEVQSLTCQGRSRRRRENAFVNEPLPERDAIGEIDFQDVDSRPPDERLAHQDGTIPAEVPPPLVTARVEQRDDFSRYRINSGYIRPFMIVAGEAGQA